MNRPIFVATMLSTLLAATPLSSAFVSTTSAAFARRTGLASRRSYSRSVLSMKLQTAIVGLPNVGKSTLFNALTETQGAEAANYPFCTVSYIMLIVLFVVAFKNP